MPPLINRSRLILSVAAAMIVAGTLAAAAVEGAGVNPDLAARIAAQREAIAHIDARLAEAREARAALKTNPRDVERAATLSGELAQARSSREELEGRASALWAAIATKAPLDDNPDVAASDAVAVLLERERQIRADLDEASVTLLDNHPRIKALRAQLSEVKAGISAEARKMLSGIERETKAAKAREDELAAELARLGDAARQASKADVELASLEVQSASQHKVLENYLAEARAASAQTVAEAVPATPQAAPPAESAGYGSRLLTGLAALVALTLIAAFVRRRRRGATGSVPAGEAPMPMEGASEALRQEFPAADESEHPTAPYAATAQHEAKPLPDDPGDGAQTPLRRFIGEIGVEQAAEKIIATGTTRAVFLSPEGDEGAASSILVAREIADAGLRVILVDLTSAGAASEPMLGGGSHDGITNLLVSEAQFGEIIHRDAYSSCDVIPVGTADPVRAMRAAERLPIILDSLGTAYDVVVVECGAVEGEAVRRLVPEGTSVLISAIEPSEEIAVIASDLDEQGIGRPMIVSPAGYVHPLAPDRSAA